MLKEFFIESIAAKGLSVDKKKKSQRVMLTNKTSLPYTVRIGKGNPVVIRPLSSVIVATKPGKPLPCTVLNMWYGMDAHPIVKLKY